jgi:uncharacterized protein YbaR (Trm112 family)
MLDKDLLDILACPDCHAPLVLDGDRLVCTCPQTRRAYRVEDDIPVLLIEESTVLTPEEHAAALQRAGAKPHETTSKPTGKK